MTTQESVVAKTIAQLGHHPGQHIHVNLEGKLVGGVHFENEQWVPATIVGLPEGASYLNVKLDAPVGAGERHRLLGRASRARTTSGSTIPVASERSR